MFDTYSLSYNYNTKPVLILKEKQDGFSYVIHLYRDCSMNINSSLTSAYYNRITIGGKENLVQISYLGGLISPPPIGWASRRSGHYRSRARLHRLRPGRLSSTPSTISRARGENALSRIKLGYALTGSFCTFDANLALMASLVESYDVIPILSFNAATLDTRFGKAKDFISHIEEMCGRPVIRTIEDAEPIGPTHMTDIMLISPCTGNTLAKLAVSIVDTPVTMAVKSHLRNNLPVVVAVSTNDALSGCAKNIGTLANLRNYYFVPLGQDHCKGKPTSLVAKFELIPEAISSALKGIQTEPVLLAAYK